MGDTDCSLMMYLRQGKKCWTTDTGREKGEGNNSADTSVSEEGCKEVLQMPDQKLSATHAPQNHGRTGYSPTVHGVPQKIISSHFSPQRNPRWSRCIWRKLQACGEQSWDQTQCQNCTEKSPSWNRVLPGAGPCAGSMLVLSIPEGLHLVVCIHARVVLEELSSVGSCVGLVEEQLHLVGGTLLWSSGKEWEWKTETWSLATKVCETTVTLIQENCFKMLQEKNNIISLIVVSKIRIITEYIEICSLWSN